MSNFILRDTFRGYSLTREEEILAVIDSFNCPRELAEYIINKRVEEKELKDKLREYLAIPSTDGRLIRRELREELAELIK